MARTEYKQKVSFTRQRGSDIYTITKLVGLVSIEGRRNSDMTIPCARKGDNFTEKQVKDFIEDNSKVVVDIS